MLTDAMLAVLACFLMSLLFTWLVRYYALHKGVMDVPNARSSHAVPTPRGGGLGMVAAFLTTLLFVLLAGLVPAEHHLFLWALLLAGVALAIVGFVDDHGGLPVRVRLAVHLASGALLAWACQQIAPFNLGFGPIAHAWLAYPLATLGVVWVLNLTNFMDGIDGLAGGQAFLACALVAVFVWFGSHGLGAFLPVALLAAASLGFLVWNFPPAKIFMGDVGSGALGLFFGGFALWHAALLGSQWLYVWLLLLGVFVVDATYTLVRRALRKQNLGQAHRSHAFQRASRRLKGHKPVTLCVYGIIIFWLAPWAWLVAFYGIHGMVALVLAYLPLLAIAKYFKAGELDD
ncbi:MAG TPA: glycosyltransferase family 4 protein [Limnobacter sp.]|nr:glycosyltransferase family 4 protein [Limnobacter sp.]